MSRAQFWTIVGLFVALAGLMLETRYQDAVERANTRAEIQDLRAETRAGIEALRTELHAEIASLRADLNDLRDKVDELNTRVSRMEGRLETVLRERDEGARVTRETVKAIVEEVLAERGL